MAILDDIGGYINTNTSFTLGTDFFLSLLPDTPDNCVALFESGGVAPQYTQGSTGTPVIERPELQVITRHTSYETGRANANTVYLLLTAITNATINSNLYYRIEAAASPAMFQRDDSRRVLFTTNFNVMRDTP